MKTQKIRSKTLRIANDVYAIWRSSVYGLQVGHSMMLSHRNMISRETRPGCGAIKVCISLVMIEVDEMLDMLNDLSKPSTNCYAVSDVQSRQTGSGLLSSSLLCMPALDDPLHLAYSQLS